MTLESDISPALLNFRPPTHDRVERVAPIIKDAGGELFRATDIIERGGKVIGFLGIGAVPAVHVWMNKEHAKMRDHLQVLSYIEGTLARQGVVDFFLPVESTSSLYPFIERGGYIKAHEGTLFIKRL